MEVFLSVVVMMLLIGVLSTATSRLFLSKQGVQWVWKNSSIIGWTLIVAGTAIIMVGFLVDKSGMAMSVKLAFGSLLLIGGLFLIW